MFEMYKKALPQMGGYMNNQGQIEFERLEKLLLLLAEWEEDKFFELHPSGKHALSKKTSKKGKREIADYRSVIYILLFSVIFKSSSGSGNFNGFFGG
jgi:5'-3' exonuclease